MRAAAAKGSRVHGYDAFTRNASAPVLSADAEFRATANAAFAAWLKQPPYIAYRADVEVSVPAENRAQHIARAVEVRTRDDTAVLQDLPQGQNQLGHAFPIPPWFDALSYFRLDYRLGDPFRQHNPITQLTMYAPLHYTDAVASAPGVTVIVTSLRNYYAAYAADSTDRILHITMQALPALTRDNTSDFYLHDVYVDATTDLPTRVVYEGPTTEFAMDYTTTNGDYWLIDHATYRKTLALPFHLIQSTITTEGTFSNFTFPATPADPRLR
jgi:hypothetical protein